MNLLMTARLVIARNWKLKYMFQLSEWYNKVWGLAINDKLTCAIGFKKGFLQENKLLYGKS